MIEGYSSPENPENQWVPRYFRPIWHVGHLVWKGGIPALKMSPLNGGGFIPMRSLAGKEQPLWQPYVTPLVSQTAGGHIPSRPNFLTALLGGSRQAGVP